LYFYRHHTRRQNFLVWTVAGITGISISS
jgi:hypothetical protein